MQYIGSKYTKYKETKPFFLTAQMNTTRPIQQTTDRGSFRKSDEIG